MSLIAKQFGEVWDALRADSAQASDSLDNVRIRNLRGIRELEVRFRYPVSVVVGANGCGKSTLLFACACAYDAPLGGGPDLGPADLFPDFAGGRDRLTDAATETELGFWGTAEGERFSTMWKRQGGSWGCLGSSGSGVPDPERHVYLRTLATLTSRSSEAREWLRPRSGRLPFETKPFKAEMVPPSVLVLAHRVLPWEYRRVVVASKEGQDLPFGEIKLAEIGDHKRFQPKEGRDLLFAELKGDPPAKYSEFHMSSGERAILRISKDLSPLDRALVLIDEIEAGLHPHAQQLLMLELQRLALRRKLQVVVATHSPVVLASVPPEGRIVLERDERTGEVAVGPPYRDIFQKALYGQSRDQLSILCEDAVAEGVIRGILDVLSVRMDLRNDDFVIGRNTGRDEFPGHVRTLGKFDKLWDFVIVLDGDSRDKASPIAQAAQEFSHPLEPLFLPGDGPPEAWIWRRLERAPEDYASLLGMTASAMRARHREIEQLFEGRVRNRADSAKGALEAFCNALDRMVPDVARLVGRREAERGGGDGMAAFVGQLKEQIEAWRRR